MSPRVGGTAPRKVTAPKVEAPVVEQQPAATLPETKPDSEFGTTAKKLVNMTGRYKAVFKQGAVKSELAADVSKMRSSVQAGTSSTKVAPNVKAALDRLAKGESLGDVFKGLDTDTAREVFKKLPASTKALLEAPGGTFDLSVRMAQVQCMTPAQLTSLATAVREGKVKDSGLKLALATEVAARTPWAKANPGALDLMREYVKTGKLGFEDVDPQFSKTTEALTTSLMDISAREYDAVSARIDTAVKSAKNPRGSARIVHVDGQLSPTVAYDKLPSDLRSKLPEKVWTEMTDLKQRGTLISTYARLKGWGVWDQVKSVKGTLNPVEAHAKVGGAEFEVAGNTGGVVFEAKDPKKFKEALIKTGHFGVDKGVVGSLHQGQESTREWTDDPGSLHVSIGPGSQFDTHMDKHSPVNEPKNGETNIDPKKGYMHHSREVWPEMIRNVIGVPGVIIDVSMKPGSRDGKPEVTGTVNIELRGPVKPEKKKIDQKTMDRINQAPPKGDPGPADVLATAVKNVDLSKVKFPKPAGVDESGKIDPQAMAEHLAALILEGARSGKNPIELDLVDYAHLKNLQPEMLNQLEKLGTQVRAELEKAIAALPKDQRAAYDLDSVTRLRITFGVKTQGGTVSLAG